MKILALIAALFVGVAIAGGCDTKEVKHEQKTTHQNDDGTKTTEHKKVTEDEEGNKTTTTEKSVDRP